MRPRPQVSCEQNATPGNGITTRQVVKPLWTVPGWPGKRAPRTAERMPSAATTRSASSSPSGVSTRAGLRRSPGTPGSVRRAGVPVRTAPDGSSPARRSTRVARCSRTSGPPKRSAAAAASARASHRPLGVRSPPSPCQADRARMSSPRPMTSRARSALGDSEIAAPTGSREGARSSTVTRAPRRRRAAAAVSPPMPPPITIARSAAAMAPPGGFPTTSVVTPRLHRTTAVVNRVG